MDSIDQPQYPYEDNPEGRRPQTLSDWQAQQRAKGLPDGSSGSPLARFQSRRNADALDVAVIDQHQRWRTEGVDPDAADPEDALRIERNNARFAAEVETFAESWLLDTEIADIITGTLDPSDWTPGPGV